MPARTLFERVKQPAAIPSGSSVYLYLVLNFTFFEVWPVLYVAIGKKIIKAPSYKKGKRLLILTAFHLRHFTITELYEKIN